MNGKQLLNFQNKSEKNIPLENQMQISFFSQTHKTMSH